MSLIPRARTNPPRKGLNFLKTATGNGTVLARNNSAPFQSLAQESAGANEMLLAGLYGKRRLRYHLSDGETVEMVQSQ